MELHEIENFNLQSTPRFRRLRVESGWLYNFWCVSDMGWRPEWIYVPEHSCIIENLNINAKQSLHNGED